MANYNISSSNNYIIYNDQTGSTLYDTGGPAGNYGDNENIYFSIAPAYSTGTLTLKLTSFKSESTYDYLRIYSDIPPTSSFQYTATTAGGYLLAVFNGPSVVVPQTITSSTGKAYIRWNSDSSVNDTGFALEWTGSGFYTVDSSSAVVRNKYALTLPSTLTSGSYITFDKGIFTGSTLTADKDILFGAWLKADKGNRDTVKRGIFGLGNTDGKGITIAKEASSGDFSFYYRDNNGAFTSTFTDIMMGGNSAAEPITTYIPQWHYYGIALRKTSTTGAVAYAYRDGQLFATSSIVYTASWAALSSSSDLVLGAYRTSNVIQGTANTWSGSFDDVFMATVATGAGATAFDNFYSSIYNSGNWADPNTVVTGAFTSGYTPRVLFNWRFEETGSILNTKDYGYYGNTHSASATGSSGGAPKLTSISSGISYTPYSSLAYSASAAAVVSNATVSFTTSSASVYENTGSYVFGISILTASVGQSATASIVLTSSSDTTASIGTNYNLIYAGTTYSSSAQMPIYVSFSAGDTTTKYITASIIDNTTYTNTSASVPLKIEQGTSTNITATSPFTFTLKILDYEEGIPSFTSSSYSIGESSSSVRIYVDRTSGSSGPLQVSYDTEDITAIAGENYEYTFGNLSWNNEETTQKYFDVPIINNNYVQTPDLTFKVYFTSLSTGSFVNYPNAISSSIVTIIDQEAGTFKINSSSYSVTEGNSVTVQVDRYSGSFGNVTVNITSSNGTAVSGTDYTAVNQNLTFADGEITKTFSVSTINNSTDVTGSLYFNIGINTISASYGAGLVGSISSATINIIDNESGSIRFTSSSYTGSLGNTITIPVERYNGSDFSASASIGVSGGTAIAGVDYTNIFPYTVSWADQVSGTVNISLTTLTLNSWTSDKTLILTASNLTNITTGSIMTASILIKTNVLVQSANQYSDYSTDFTINKYLNLSNQFTRKTDQVPFSLGNNPFVRLQQAYSSST